LNYKGKAIKSVVTKEVMTKVIEQFKPCKETDPNLFLSEAPEFSEKLELKDF
jgi:hypothetical protein